MAVSVACMAIYTTLGFKGRTFKLCVLTRWDLNFCVRSSPLRGSTKEVENLPVEVEEAVNSLTVGRSLRVENIPSELLNGGETTTKS